MEFCFILFLKDLYNLQNAYYLNTLYMLYRSWYAYEYVCGKKPLIEHTFRK